MIGARPLPSPILFAGLPLQRWIYAIRIWAAMVIALTVAFWLQLDGASSAAVSVSILAIQTHGQTFQKASYRLAATGVGIAASIAIAGLFTQARDLYIIAVSIWLGLCVFVGGLFDGNRAYGAVLAGYTVSIVAVLQIDTPQNVFLSGINRGAAIVVAIASLALVNSLTGAPSVLAGFERKVADARAAVIAFVAKTLQADMDCATVAAALMKRLTGLHPEITALYFDSTSGRHRGRAARKLAAALVMEVEAAYAFVICDPTDQSSQREVVRALQDGDDDLIIAIRSRLIVVASDASDLTVTRLIRLLNAEIAVREALADFGMARRPGRRTRLHLYRSRRVAAWNACRVMLVMTAIGFAGAATNWPATSVIYGFAGVIAVLGASMPDIRAFSKITLIGAPVAAVVVGVVQFLILDGASQFELLAFGLAPATIVAALLQSSPQLPRAWFGFVLLVFVPMILSPSNPESYDFESYLLTSVFTILSAALVYVSLIVFPPLSERRRLRWMMADARKDAWRALQGATSVPIDEAAFREADRIGQISSSVTDGPSSVVLQRALLLAEISNAARAAYVAVGSSQDVGTEARAALAAFDASGLRAAAMLACAQPDHGAGSNRADRDAAAALSWLAALAETQPFATIEMEMP